MSEVSTKQDPKMTISLMKCLLGNFKCDRRHYLIELPPKAIKQKTCNSCQSSTSDSSLPILYCPLCKYALCSMCAAIKYKKEGMSRSTLMNKVLSNRCRNNIADESAHIGSEYGMIYCSNRYVSYGDCFCGHCDGRCGPNNGCPCPDCALSTELAMLSSGLTCKRDHPLTIVLVDSPYRCRECYDRTNSSCLYLGLGCEICGIDETFICASCALKSALRRYENKSTEEDIDDDSVIDEMIKGSISKIEEEIASLKAIIGEDYESEKRRNELTKNPILLLKKKEEIIFLSQLCNTYAKLIEKHSETDSELRRSMNILKARKAEIDENNENGITSNEFLEEEEEEEKEKEMKYESDILDRISISPSDTIKIITNQDQYNISKLRAMAISNLFYEPIVNDPSLKEIRISLDDPEHLFGLFLSGKSIKTKYFLIFSRFLKNSDLLFQWKMQEGVLTLDNIAERFNNFLEAKFSKKEMKEELQFVIKNFDQIKDKINFEEMSIDLFIYIFHNISRMKKEGDKWMIMKKKFTAENDKTIRHELLSLIDFSKIDQSTFLDIIQTVNPDDIPPSLWKTFQEKTENALSDSKESKSDERREDCSII